MGGQETAADLGALRLAIFAFPSSVAVLRRVDETAEGGLFSQFQLFRPPALALAAETLSLERTLSDLVNQTYALTPTESVELVICSSLICSGGSLNR